MQGDVRNMRVPAGHLLERWVFWKGWAFRDRTIRDGNIPHRDSWGEDWLFFFRSKQMVNNNTERLFF